MAHGCATRKILTDHDTYMCVVDRLVQYMCHHLLVIFDGMAHGYATCKYSTSPLRLKINVFSFKILFKHT